MTTEDVERFRSGDDACLTEVLREHSPKLLGVALRLCGDRTEAHELVQDTWVRAFRTRAQFAGTGSMTGWLIAIMRSEHLSKVRSTRRAGSRAARYVAAADESVITQDETDDRVDARRKQGQLLEALEGLGSRQREVVMLRIVEGYSVRDTATVLGMAEGTVKATLAQALRRLRDLMST